MTTTPPPPCGCGRNRKNIERRITDETLICDPDEPCAGGGAGLPGLCGQRRDHHRPPRHRGGGGGHPGGRPVGGSRLGQRLFRGRKEPAGGVSHHQPPCGGELYQREDQKPEVVQNRLEVYKNSSEQLIKYYEDKNVLRTEKAGDKVGRTSYDIAEEIEKELK